MGERFMERAQKGSGVTVIGDQSVDVYAPTNGTPRPSIRVTVSTAECQSRMKEAGSANAPAPTTAQASADNDIPF
jgi:single-stranded DNA-binding protein